MAQQANGCTTAFAYRRDDPFRTLAIELVMNARLRRFAELRARLRSQGKELDMPA